VQLNSSSEDLADVVQQRQSTDNLSIDLEEVLVPTLTDVLLRVCRTTLEKNRQMLNMNPDIRSVTMTIRLSETGQPYKVLLLPSHESKG